MDVRELKTFRMVASTLNFTQAAAALGYVQSSVTAHIQALEEELGVRLFDRLGKRVALTGAGERLLKYADRVLALMEEARTAVSGEGDPAGSLVISAPETLCTYRLPSILHRFRQRFPQVRISFRPAPCANLRRLVGEGMLDLAFVLEESFESVSLTVERLVVEPVDLIVPPGHRLASLQEVRAADLEGEPVLLTELGCAYRNQFERALIASGVYPSEALEFSSVEAIKQCVIAGIGVAVLPAVTVAAEISAGQLVALRWADHPIEVVTQMIWHKDKWISPALRAFVGVVHEVLAAPAEPCANAHQG
ncbi:MAG: LysR family transcriptional regulator [Firmicutes bacterium]|nr:LysR family transcriptional regulator [Bacillota bacterium]